MTAESIFWAVLPALIVGVVLAIFNRKQNKRDKEAEKHAEARKEESLLALDLQMANAKLAYATAMALKRGHANGEVKDGIKAYEQAKKNYFDFMNRQAAEHLTT